MEHDRCGFVAKFFEDLCDVVGRDSGELCNAAIDEEALEPANTGFDQRTQLRGITRNYAAVEANVNPTLTLCSLYFFLQTGEGSSGGNGVQWHVNHGRHSTERRGLSASVESLPFCPAGFVQVDVCVDEARKQDIGRVICVLGIRVECFSW